jgi:hypothetical protein
MSTVFVLKPIIDVLYEEVSQYKKEIERLNKIISELTERKTNVKTVRVVPKTVKEEINEEEDYEDVDEDSLAELAAAPPSSSQETSLLEQVENQNKIIEKPTTVQEESKTVKLIAGKDKKEYMKEYHRNYRKKQKEIQQKNNSVSK